MLRTARPATTASVFSSDQQPCHGTRLKTMSAGSETTLESELRQRRQAELMRRILLDLSPLSREILVRFYSLRQDIAQICKETGVTEEHVKLLKRSTKARFEALASEWIGQKTAEIGVA